MGLVHSQYLDNLDNVQEVEKHCIEHITGNGITD